MQEVLEFLKKYHVFYLATEEDGQPHVRPFGVSEIYDGHLYTQTGKKKNVAQQLKKNPKAEICCFGDGKWVRIECELIWDDRYETLHYLLEQNPNLRRMYDENDGNCLGLRYENATATFYSFTEPPRTVKF
ncbi:MAG: pyridoxamine 5'-phosphate oxidase family protein [Firmicutes bacterium]|nr:pyridoxamine 5'-phosphate oxidase family protein [Bacillota bacterium]